MRRYFTLLISILILWSCRSPKDLVLPEIILTGPEELETICADAYSGVIHFKATADWTAKVNISGSEAWVSVSPASGTAADDCSVTYNVKANTGDTERSAEIILSCGEDKKSLKLTQKEANALILSESRVEMPVEGGEFTIKYRTNVDCSFQIDAEGSSWIRETGSKSLSDHSFSFAVSINDDINKREGKITISGAGLKEIFTVFQAGEIPDFILSKDEITLTDEGGEFKIEVSSNVDVSLYVSEGDNWVKEVKPKSMSLKTFTFNAEKNESVEARTAKIEVQNTKHQLSKTVKITQMQKDAIIAAPESVQLGSRGGIISFTVGHNVDYETVLSDRWITALGEEGTKSYTEDKISFSIAANSSYSSREGTITFRSKGGDSSAKALSQTVTIEQASKDGLFIISDKHNSFDANGGELTVKLNHNISYEVIMPDADWVRKLSTKALSESEESFEILANTDVNGREANIVFINSELVLSDTLYISQAQRNALIVAPESLQITSSGGDIALTLGHNVDFDTSIDVDWIALSPTVKSYVEETIKFDVQSNTEPVGRTGHITFTSKDKSLSQTISVTQDPAPELRVTSSKENNIPAEGGTLDVSISANVAYDVILPSVNWVHEIPADNSGVHQFSIDENEAMEHREAVISFKSKEGDLSDTVMIIQARNNFFLGALDFGAYNLTDKSRIFVQNKYADQIGCMTGASAYSFKIMDPSSLKYFQLGSIPLDLKEGDSFTASILQSYSSSLSSSGDCSVVVRQMENGRVWLVSSDGKTGFIIKK